MNFEGKKPQTEKSEKSKISKEEFDGWHEFLEKNEGSAWEELLAIREKFEKNHESLFESLPIKTIEQAEEKGFEVIKKTLEAMEGVMDFSQLDPGHGLGHLTRDYLHAIILAKNIKIDPKQAYIGIISAVLHDVLGCTLIERYSESGRAIRHAEAGALLLEKIKDKIGLSENEATLISYGIAAHTHYLNPSKVKCSDGEEREIQPYKDINDKGEPIMAVWLARWADRLDLSGPCFVGRHFLTLIKTHKDFVNGEHYTVKFSSAMRPLLRNKEEIKNDPLKATAREHMSMYAQSQNNKSPYGRFDSGMMVELRDAYKSQVLEIVKSFDYPLDLSPEEAEKLLNDWGKWLSRKVEPSEAAKIGVENLKASFAELPRETQEAWFSTIKTTLEEYKKWAEKIEGMISEFSENKLRLPVIGDVKKII